MPILKQKDAAATVVFTTYTVTCQVCRQEKYPYRSSPPPNPYTCALCTMKQAGKLRGPGTRRPRSDKGKTRGPAKKRRGGAARNS